VHDSKLLDQCITFSAPTEQNLGFENPPQALLEQLLASTIMMSRRAIVGSSSVLDLASIF